MEVEGGGPEQSGIGDIALEGGVDAFEPGFIFPPPAVAAAGDVEAVLVEDGHAFDVGGAEFGLAIFLVELVDIFLGGGGVAIEPPDLFEVQDLVGGRVLGDGFEGVDDAVAAAEEDQVCAVDVAVGGGGPGAMEDAWADVFVILGDQLSGVFIEDDETGGIGRADFEVGIIDAVSGIDIEVIAEDEGGAVGCVVGVGAGFLVDIEDPDYIGFMGGEGGWGGVGRGLEGGFVGEGSVVPIGEAESIEAEHFAPVTEHVDVGAIDGGGGGHAGAWPVGEDIAAVFRDEDLPLEGAVEGIEGHEGAAVAFVSGVARGFVIGTDEDLVVGGDGGGMGFRAEFSDPAGIEVCGGVDGIWQVGGGGVLVTGEFVSPVGGLGGGGVRGYLEGEQGEQGEVEFHGLGVEGWVTLRRAAWISGIRGGLLTRASTGAGTSSSPRIIFPQPVIMMTGEAGEMALMRVVSSAPSMTGMPKSVMTTSTGWLSSRQAWKIWRASGPPSAQRTSWPSVSRISRTSSRRRGSSST